ncbi:MAG: hypothetical protein RIS47_808, partial [Bacteroidota bacterium]
MKTLQSFFVLLFAIAHIHSTKAQSTLVLTLPDVIRLADSKSLQATLNHHSFLISEWSYKSYKANYLPSLSLYAAPLSYNNASNLRYNSNTQTDEYVRTQTLNSYAYLTASQNVALTGGTLFAKTSLNRIKNYGANGYDQYSSVPFQIGYSQQISGYNAMKWERKIAPLKYTIAQKEYLQSEETNHLQSVAYFFDLALAQEAAATAALNLHNNQQILEIARKRYELGTLTQSEVLTFELQYNNARITDQSAQIDLRQAHEALLSYLLLPIDIQIVLTLPQELPLSQIDASQVLGKALENNPALLTLDEAILEASQNVSKTRSQRYIQASVSASYGLSKNDGTNGQVGELAKVYQSDFDKYSSFNLGITIPILDWGQAKGQYQMARSQQQVAELSAQQARQQFEQSVRTFSTTFNL